MTYLINKTDGSLLTEIIDSEIDTTATDLTLVGKNVTGYGEFINENFVKLLENFASTTEPSNPLAGQLWFDQTENRLKVYDGNGFIIAAGPILSGNPPLTPNQGDFWIDNREKQLYFYDGARSRFPAGKIWGDNQGKSGFEVNTVSDSFGNLKTLTYLFNGGNLLGIFSNHLEFTPNPLITGFTTIKPGFNVSSNANNFKLYAKAESAEFLETQSGDLIPPEDFLIFNQPNLLTETLTIASTQPLVLGSGSETAVIVSSGITEIRNQPGQDFRINIFNDPTPVLYAKTGTQQIGIFNNNPQAALDVTGNVIISGDLTVNGSTTIINTTELSIEDKNITLARGSVSDIDSDGGGITLKGTTDKTFSWVDLTDSWTSSENIDLAFGKSYKIDGVDVLSQTTLSSSVTSATGLTQVGILSSLKVGNISTYVEINNNVIDTSAGSLVLGSATSSIDVSNKILTNVANPIGQSDAVNKGYLELIASNPWSFPTPILHFAVSGDRFLVDTISASTTIVLPSNPQPGATVRFIDYSGSFSVNPLYVLRAREVATGTLFGVSGTVLQTFLNCPTTAVTGIGTGLVLNITITQDTTSYLSTNTTIEVVDPGVGYKDGDQILVLGTDLGGFSPANDLTFELELKNIFGIDDDLTSSNPNSAFSLIFTSASQGWQYSDSLSIPSVIYANIVGNVTGNVTGNLLGNVTGNVSGSASSAVVSQTVDLIATNTTNALHYINFTSASSGPQSIRTDTSLTYNPNTNTLTSNSFVGNLTGNITNCNTITAQNSLTVETITSNIRLISGNSGLRISAYDDTKVQEQYAVEVTPGTAPGNRSRTLLFGDVSVVNLTGANSNGSSFRLPSYTVAERDARTLSFLNYGELIFNSDLNKIQAYISPGTWVNLH
jgi:hypothetical protein